MPELRVRGRTVSDGRAGARDSLDVAVGEPNAVDEERAGLEHSKPVEQRDGRCGTGLHGDTPGAQAVGETSATLLDEQTLELRLRDVERHRQPLVERKAGRGLVQVVQHGVRRVRRYPDAHQWRLERARGVDLLAKLAHRRLTLRRVGTENLLVHDAAHAAVAERVDDDPGMAG